ncbi:MAG: TlpA family protein disulfide reductase, partial [Dehalococcoidia bacterium]|nr:TlpA family protein disulfide reductase [Dehalococcoidia bacterium]
RPPRRPGWRGPTPAPTPRTILSTSSTDAEAAPDFEVETFDGETLRLSDLNGKVVVLNFWASWCPPCRWEMPFFETMWQEYRDQGVVFVGIAMSDTLENVKAFAEESGVTYPVGLDTTTEIARAYEVLSLPTTFFIGKDGTIERKLTSAANEGLLKVFLRGQLRRQ